MWLKMYLSSLVILCIVGLSEQEHGEQQQQPINQDVMEALRGFENRLEEKITSLFDEKMLYIKNELMNIRANTGNVNLPQEQTINEVDNNCDRNPNPNITEELYYVRTTTENVLMLQEKIIDEQNRVFSVLQKDLKDEFDIIRADIDCSFFKSPSTSVNNIPSTTEGPTTSPNPIVHTVGNDQFVSFKQAMKWEAASVYCQSQSENLNFYQPKDIMAVAKYLYDNFKVDNSSMFYWVGTRGNGTHQVYPGSGDVLTEDDPWFVNIDYTYVDTNTCPILDSRYWEESNNTKILNAYTGSCSGTYASVLCG